MFFNTVCICTSIRL